MSGKMSLRIRLLESRETMKHVTKNSSTLQDLKHEIAQKISPSSSPTSLYLSLDGVTEIPTTSPTAHLASLGIFSGTLIHYTLNPNAFKQQEISRPALETSQRNQDICNFLRKVYNEEYSGDGSSLEDDKLLIIAIHAVLLELGLLFLHYVTDKEIVGFRLPHEWESTVGYMDVTMRYTIPDLQQHRELVEILDVNFRLLKDSVLVFGTLGSEYKNFYKLNHQSICLFASSIRAVCENSMQGKILNLNVYHEKKVYEFWKIVKDSLAFPLVVDLCEKTKLEYPPPCFMRLPSDVKLKILELLPAADIAKVGYVCSDVRCLIDDLCKKKHKEVFPWDTLKVLRGRWKPTFDAQRFRKRRRTRYQP